MTADESPTLSASLLKRWVESEKSCAQDMQALLSLSAQWDELDREQIATDAALALASVLGLDFAAVQFTFEAEIFRHSASNSVAREPSAALRQILHDLPQETFVWPTSGVLDWRNPSGGPAMRVVRVPVGLRDDGWLFAGSIEENFPKDSEFVVFTACANLIAIALRKWRAGHALRDREELFRMFSENSPSVLWLVKVEAMQIEYISPAFASIWGRTSETMLGDIIHWLDTIHPEDRIGMVAALDSVIHGEIIVQQYRIIRSKLVMRRIRHLLFPIHNEHGRVARVGGFAEDITKPAEVQVYILSGEASSRQRLALLLQTNGYDVKAFTSSRAFLEAAPVLVPGCLILDRSGTETKDLRIVAELQARRIDLPIIVVGKSRGDVGAAVRAMKAGATDWLEPPYDGAEVLAAVASALAIVQNLRDADHASKLARAHLAEMTPREREVLLGLVAGETNKEIARRRGISPRTVETHRAHVMERLGARTLSEAVLLAASTGLLSA